MDDFAPVKQAEATANVATAWRRLERAEVLGMKDFPQNFRLFSKFTPSDCRRAARRINVNGQPLWQQGPSTSNYNDPVIPATAAACQAFWRQRHLTLLTSAAWQPSRSSFCTWLCSHRGMACYVEGASALAPAASSDLLVAAVRLQADCCPRFHVGNRYAVFPAPERMQSHNNC